MPFALAGWLWARDRREYLRFAKRLVTLAIAGVLTYILFPAAPPWMAARKASSTKSLRTTREGWKIIGVGTSVLFYEGQAASTWSPRSPRCTPPSRCWSPSSSGRVLRWRRARPLLLLYPAAMGLTLMATGEHYFFDVLVGWCYAGAVMAGWAWWERRRRERAATTRCWDVKSPSRQRLHSSAI